MRRNPLPGIPVAPSAKSQKPEPLAGLTALGIVCNPKTHEPLLIVTDGDYVSLRSLKRAAFGKRIGRGYYEGSRNEPAERTGYPRCHTPDGVSIKGGGYGTALYSALAVGAHLVSERSVAIDMWEKADGICSWTEDRSSEADKWWDAAVNRNLAEREEYEDRETEENVELRASPSDLDDLVDSNQQITYVNEVNVDVETIKDKIVEVLRYDAVSVEVHLVAATFAIEVPAGVLENAIAVEHLWQEIQNGAADGSLEPPDPIALMATDVRGLDRQAVNLLSVLYGEADLGDAVRDELEERFQAGIDPATPFKQRHLFTPNHAGLAEVELARKEARWQELADLP